MVGGQGQKSLFKRRRPRPPSGALLFTPMKFRVRCGARRRSTLLGRYGLTGVIAIRGTPNRSTRRRRRATKVSANDLQPPVLRAIKRSTAPVRTARVPAPPEPGHPGVIALLLGSLVGVAWWLASFSLGAARSLRATGPSRAPPRRRASCPLACFCRGGLRPVRDRHPEQLGHPGALMGLCPAKRRLEADDRDGDL